MKNLRQVLWCTNHTVFSGAKHWPLYHIVEVNKCPFISPKWQGMAADLQTRSLVCPPVPCVVKLCWCTGVEVSAGKSCGKSSLSKRCNIVPGFSAEFGNGGFLMWSLTSAWGITFQLCWGHGHWWRNGVVNLSKRKMSWTVCWWLHLITEPMPFT